MFAPICRKRRRGLIPAPPLLESIMFLFAAFYRIVTIFSIVFYHLLDFLFSSPSYFCFVSQQVLHRIACLIFFSLTPSYFCFVSQQVLHRIACLIFFSLIPSYFCFISQQVLHRIACLIFFSLTFSFFQKKR